MAWSNLLMCFCDVASSPISADWLCRPLVQGYAWTGIRPLALIKSAEPLGYPPPWKLEETRNPETSLNLWLDVNHGLVSHSGLETEADVHMGLSSVVWCNTFFIQKRKKEKALIFMVKFGSLETKYLQSGEFSWCTNKFFKSTFCSCWFSQIFWSSTSIRSESGPNYGSSRPKFIDPEKIANEQQN